MNYEHLSTQISSGIARPGSKVTINGGQCVIESIEWDHEAISLRFAGGSAVREISVEKLGPRVQFGDGR